MNFDFSDDQKFLQQEARRFLEANCPIETVRAVLEGDAPHDRALWDSLAHQGWLGTAVPEAYGGLGLGHLELCLLAEELGRALAPVPFGSSVYLFTEAVKLWASEAQKQAWLPELIAGRMIGCLATVERPGPFTEASVLATVAGGRLTGVKTAVTDGSGATHALVLARDGDGFGLFVADLADAAREPLDTLDPSRDVARLVFANAPVERLGKAGDGLALLERLTDRAAILFAFEQCGGADRCLEMARAYALDRYAFGRVIGSYQAVKHKLADMYVKNALARANAYYGAWALNADAPGLTVAASAARIAASDAFWFAAKESIQTHGGIGTTWEMNCHLFYRRARQLSLVVGSPEQWKQRAYVELQRGDAAPSERDTIQKRHAAG